MTRERQRSRELAGGYKWTIETAGVSEDALARCKPAVSITITDHNAPASMGCRRCRLSSLRERAVRLVWTRARVCLAPDADPPDRAASVPLPGPAPGARGYTAASKQATARPLLAGLSLAIYAAATLPGSTPATR